MVDSGVGSTFRLTIPADNSETGPDAPDIARAESLPSVRSVPTCLLLPLLSSLKPNIFCLGNTLPSCRTRFIPLVTPGDSLVKEGGCQMKRWGG